MILVTVGGDVHAFTRLLEAVEGLLRENKVKDRIIMQIGHAKFKSKYCECFDFIDIEDFERLMKLSDLIISHCGAGTIISALNYDKPVIVVPRRKEFNEHVDNHQVRHASILAKQESIIPVYDCDELEGAIELARTFERRTRNSKRDKIIRTIERFCGIEHNQDSHP